jgi:hypothetical protein
MIEIRPITPEDAAAVGRLLQQLGYAVEPLQVSGRIGQLGKTGSDPILLAVSDRRVLGFIAMPLSMRNQTRTPSRGTAFLESGA